MHIIMVQYLQEHDYGDGLQEINLFNTAWQISITSTYPKSFNMTMWLQLAQKTVEECMH